ncbi:MAG: hypothetical protein K0Q93_3022 [Nocardioidaceae bacterium]|jgi:hypothetical protein|nr:hypothetical protein [Nocardioidaceae bacterium]
MDPELMTAAEFDSIYTEAVSALDRADEQWDYEQSLTTD